MPRVLAPKPPSEVGLFTSCVCVCVYLRTLTVKSHPLWSPPHTTMVAGVGNCPAVGGLGSLLSAVLSFKGHLLPFMCRTLELFVDNPPLITPP